MEVSLKKHVHVFLIDFLDLLLTTLSLVLQFIKKD